MRIHYFINDFEMLNRTRFVISKIVPEAQNIIYDKEGSSIDTSDVEKDEVVVLNHSLSEVKEGIEKQGKEALIIVINEIVNDFEDFPVEIYISRSRVVTSVASVFYDLKLKHKKECDYFCISLENISLGKPSPCDFYLKINDGKFLKCFNYAEVFDKDNYEHFKKKTNELWVTRLDFYNHASFLYGQSDLEAAASEPFNPKNADHLALLHDMARSCGISEKTISAVENTISGIKDHPDKQIKKLLLNFDKMKGSFLYSHSYFTSLLSVEVASAQKWFKHQHMDKLVLVSLVHDLGFRDKDNAIYEGLPLSKLKQLDASIKDDIIDHVDNVLKILDGCAQIDSDIINMIKRHHGGRGEDSYPNKSFATEFDLLSGIFLLSHAFTTAFFKVSLNPKKISHVLAYVAMIYDRGNLKKIFPEFKASIEEKLL